MSRDLEVSKQLLKAVQENNIEVVKQLINYEDASFFPAINAIDDHRLLIELPQNGRSIFLDMIKAITYRLRYLLLANEIGLMNTMSIEDLSIVKDYVTKLNNYRIDDQDYYIIQFENEKDTITARHILLDRNLSEEICYKLALYLNETYLFCSSMYRINDINLLIKLSEDIKKENLNRYIQVLKVHGSLVAKMKNDLYQMDKSESHKYIAEVGDTELKHVLQDSKLYWDMIFD